MEKELLEKNPFQSIDVNGVGNLINIGTCCMEVKLEKRNGSRDLRRAWRRPKFYQILSWCRDLSYVSASPHRIPIAIVAAAQAAIEQPKKIKETKKK